MNKIVFLDTGPLSLITNPKASGTCLACNKWMINLIKQGVRICIPEIADYELRRELIRGSKAAGIKRLDALARAVDYIQISTIAMRANGEQTGSDTIYSLSWPAHALGCCTPFS